MQLPDNTPRERPHFSDGKLVCPPDFICRFAVEFTLNKILRIFVFDFHQFPIILASRKWIPSHWTPSQPHEKIGWNSILE